MERTIRVLIVEDSAFVTKVVCDILQKNMRAICDSASTVKEALVKIRLYPYDIILLDYVLPDGTGIDVLRKGKGSLKGYVILFSSLAQEGADITVQALSEGAADFILKPGWGGMLADDFSQEIVSKVQALLSKGSATGSEMVPSEFNSSKAAGAVQRMVNCPGTAKGVIVVASSTGGPQALRRFLGRFERVNVPVVIAQHMPPVFTKSLAEQLARVTALNVIEANSTMALQSNMVFVITGGKHGVINDEKLEIIDGPPVNGVKPAADLLFASAAESYKSQTLGVVLTGMGKDGLEGSRLIKQLGGKVVAESQESAVVWGMPGEVVKNGLADAVDHLESLPYRVEEIITTWK